MKPRCATMTPMRLRSVDCTKTLLTSLSPSESLSTKNTRSELRDSRNTPGVTLETSSRLASRRWYSWLCSCAHGVMASESSAHTSATGIANCSTGLTHAAIESPEVNHT